MGILAPKSQFRYLAQEARPVHWLKNLLIFAPLIASHLITNPHLFSLTLLAFVSFSLSASALYIVNDIIDAPHDKKHPLKCNRPLASGLLSNKGALLGAVFLLTTSGVLAYQLPSYSQIVIILYIAMSFLYSIFLKKIVMLDVIFLALFYTMRLFAGSTAAAIPISPWMLAFSMFLFLSLALMKRFSDLLYLQQGKNLITIDNTYRQIDINTIFTMGISSGYISVLVLALYINSDDVTELYRSPELLWLLCPFLLYWVGRIWLVAKRGLIQGDPVLFAIRDRFSYYILLLILGTLVAAI